MEWVVFLMAGVGVTQGVTNIITVLVKELIFIHLGWPEKGVPVDTKCDFLLFVVEGGIRDMMLVER